MTDREIQHEIVCSRLATEKIKRDLYEDQSKNYGSHTFFAIEYTKQTVLPFSEALVSSTSRVGAGKATTTPRALGWKKMQRLFQYVHPDVVASISLDKIFDQYFVSEFNLPITTNAAKSIGTILEIEERNQYYYLTCPEDVRSAVHKQLNTPGSHPSYKARGAKLVAEKILQDKYGWSKDQLHQPWSNNERFIIGFFILDVAAECEILVKKNLSKGKKLKGTFQLSDQLKVNAIKFQHHLEERSFFNHPLIDPPIDWEFEPGPARNNNSGGYHVHAFKENFKLQRRFDSDTTFGKDAINLLNILGKTAWNIDPDVYQVARKCFESGFSVGSFNTVFDDPRLHLDMPDYIVKKGKNDPEFKDWKSEKKALYEARQEAEAKSRSSRKALVHAADYLKKPRFYLSWSCDYRGRMYSQQSFFDQQKSDFQRSLVTFADGCKLDDSGRDWAAMALAAANKGSKWTYDERKIWTNNNTELIKRIASDPVGTITEWEQADDPWQFLQLCLEWNKVVITREKAIWDVPIGVDSTSSGLQLLSAMRRDPEGMRFSNLLKPQSASEPPQDAYREVMRIARNIAYKNPETSHLTQYLEDRSLGKVILMTRIYGSTDWSNKRKVKEHYRKEGLFPDPITYDDVQLIYKILLKSSEQVFPMAFEALKYIIKLARQVKKDGGDSFKWSTPNRDNIHLNKVSYGSIEIQTTMMGKKTIPIDVVKGPKMTKMIGSIAPDFVHSYDAAVLKSSFQGWDKPLAVIHDCIKVLPNDMDHAMERIRNGFHFVCSGDPLSRLASDLGVATIPVLKQGPGDLDAVLESKYMFN